MAKTIKKSKTGKSLKERMKEKRKRISERTGGGAGHILYVKEGTMRVRPLFVGEEVEFVFEATYFYFGKDIGGKISPSTFGEPCPAMEKYEQLKNGTDDEKEDAKKMVPRTKFFMAVAVYEDDKGKKIDEKNSGKLVLLANSLAQDIIDHFLDDEWGDPTDLDNGYDIKITRTGKTMTDTEYSMIACPKTKQKFKEYRKQFDLEAMVRENVPSYEEMESFVEQYLGNDESEEEEAPKKTPKTKGKVKGKKKRSDA